MPITHHCSANTESSRQGLDARSPSVTWLLPVWNGMPYLPETLASIEVQTYRQWEVLAWDNGSTDGTIEELHRWIPSRLPGRVVVDRPLPLAEARACLVEEACTVLCALIDADDVNEPDRLERQTRFLAEHPEVAAVGGQISVIDGVGMVSSSRSLFPLDHLDILRDMLDGPALAQPAVLFRRDAVLAVGNYRNVGPVNVEDYDLWLRLAARYCLANLTDIVLRYRVHDRSSTVIAEREGVLRRATMERFAEHAPALYGCTHREASLLAENRHAFALPVLLRIARYLRRRTGISALSTLRSGTFRRAALKLLAPWDFSTRLALVALRRRPRLFPRGLARAPTLHAVR
jgi:glycosyltransferase involved in cell wall biosynthesis